MTDHRYGSGSMAERAPGVWRLRVYLGRDQNGRPRQIQSTFRGGDRGAAKAMAKLVTDAEQGKFDRTRATVGELLDKWIEHITPVRRPSTINGYMSKIEYSIRPALGDVPLAKLGAADLDRCYNAWLGRGLATATVRQHHAILAAALHQAMKWEWIERNPADRAFPPAIHSKPMNVPTPERLTELVRKSEDDDPVLSVAVAVAALTGVRRGELVALKWSDVDLVAGAIQVERAITVVDAITHEGPTKTHQARRLALDEVGVAVLQRRWAFMVDLAERAESPLVDDPYVLSYNANGARPVNPDTLTHRFGALCRSMEKATAKERNVKVSALRVSELWPYRFHDLRHFSVTTLIAAGVDIRTVANRAGHAQTSMTLDRYAHALPERDRAAAGVLGRALEVGPEPT